MAKDGYIRLHLQGLLIALLSFSFQLSERGNVTHEGHLGVDLLARLPLPNLVHHSFLLPSHDVVDSSEGADDTQAFLPFPSPAVAADGWQEQEGDRLQD